ncbi:MAG: ATPase [Acidimicrobiaceae bacterium]|nr:ATPase [Acidimicrobiaceae bacterium]|tara:strand:+ start:3167 stop:4084 length:918 start_codon:yes stop_codon:yes gene_type:complete
MGFNAPDNPSDVTQGLAKFGYLASEGLSSSIFLSLSLQRPLFLEGDPGVGKTEVAKTLAKWTGGDLIRLQCYEGLDASQALYEWDYTKQLLHLRAAEATGRASEVSEQGLEDEIYQERFLVKRPLLKAISYSPQESPVLLIDEIDRADDEFEAFLLELLSEFSVTIPEIGTFSAEVPPIVVITSNRTRDVHDALKRRCLYHWVEHPDFDREVMIIRSRVPDVSEEFAVQIAAAVEQVRTLDLYKAPGVAESIDWTVALGRLGSITLDEETVLSTIGTLVKYREDQIRLLDHGIKGLVEKALARAG